MRTGIYEQFDTAFSKITAYAVFEGAKYVGRIAFKHGTRTYCYAQVWGARMDRGWANGGGYDKASAACEAAVAKLTSDMGRDDPEAKAHIDRWKAALAKDEGVRWYNRLESAGYTLAHVLD